jgi:hypothetical protein
VLQVKWKINGAESIGIHMPALWSMCAVSFRTEVGIMSGLDSRANTSPQLPSLIRICIRGNMNPCLWSGLRINGQLQTLTTIW